MSIGLGPQEHLPKIEIGILDQGARYDLDDARAVELRTPDADAGVRRPLVLFGRGSEPIRTDLVVVLDDRLGALRD